MKISKISKKDKKNSPGYTWMKKDKTHSGHMDTQMYPECEGYDTSRDVVKKTVERRKKKKVHTAQTNFDVTNVDNTEIDDVWNLESTDEEVASDILSQVVNKALEGSEDDQKFLINLWDGESWESIKKKVETAGSVWYVWWMDGVRKFIPMISSDGQQQDQQSKDTENVIAKSNKNMVEAKKKKKKSPREHGFIDQCIKEHPDVDNPGAYCASIVDKVKGTTKWRKGPKKEKKSNSVFNLSKYSQQIGGSVKFFQVDNPNAVFAVARDFDTAINLWKQNRWQFEIDGKRYKSDDFKGRQAIENLFGESMKLQRANSNNSKYAQADYPVRLCDCGSGQTQYPEFDARGIFLTYVCDRCKKQKLSKYRLDVLDNPQYESDEPIEPDEY